MLNKLEVNLLACFNSSTDILNLLAILYKLSPLWTTYELDPSVDV